jgi:predicted RNase H-related nuclease YkuK (DUF458 family)
MIVKFQTMLWNAIGDIMQCTSQDSQSGKLHLSLHGSQSKSTWFFPQGTPVTFSQILDEIRLHTRNGGKVYVGCDSQLSTDTCTFATAICLHGTGGGGGTYFFRKTRLSPKRFRVLRDRINAEVERSLDVAFLIKENVKNVDIEMHVDIGTTQRSKTRTFVDSITGWVRSAGVRCKVKPDAWASASIADKHTK